MATYSYTTTAAEDVGLDYAVAQANAARDPKTRAYTATSYVQARMAEILASYVQIKNTDLEVDIAVAFTKASAADQEAVKSRLGVS